jgi:hypothetical protein
MHRLPLDSQFQTLFSGRRLRSHIGKENNEHHHKQQQ